MTHFPLFLLFIISFCFTQNTYSNPKSIPKATPKVIPKAPSIAAKSFIMIDYNTGKVLAEKNSKSAVVNEID